MFNNLPILAVALAVLTANSLGLNSGMVLHLDHHGHVAVEAPHLVHLHEHTNGADHGSQDHGSDADHADLHHLIASTADCPITLQKVERASENLAASDACPLAIHPCVPFAVANDLLRPAADATSHAANHRGGTARVQIACLRTIVLTV